MSTNDTQAEVCSSDGLCQAPIHDIVDRLRNKSGAWINGLYDDEAAAEIEHLRIQLRESQTKERERWEKALKQTWQAIDPLRPAGQPGSYARGYDNGFAAALEVLRGNLKA